MPTLRNAGRRLFASLCDGSSTLNTKPCNFGTTGKFWPSLKLSKTQRNKVKYHQIIRSFGTTGQIKSTNDTQAKPVPVAALEAHGASHQSPHTGEINRLIQRDVRNGLQGMTQNIYEPQQCRSYGGPQFPSRGAQNYYTWNRRTPQGVRICNNCDRRGHTTYNLCMEKPLFTKKQVIYRSFKNFDIDLFISDTRSSSLISDPPNELDDLVARYDSELSGIFNRHVPIKKRTVTIRPAAPW